MIMMAMAGNLFFHFFLEGVCAGRARTENHCRAGENSADPKRCQPVTIYTSIILGVGLVNPVKDYMIDSTVHV